MLFESMQEFQKNRAPELRLGLDNNWSGVDSFFVPFLFSDRDPFLFVDDFSCRYSDWDVIFSDHLSDQGDCSILVEPVKMRDMIKG